MTPIPLLKCPQCARELPAGSLKCPYDGTPINSVAVRPSLWDDTTAQGTKKDHSKIVDNQALVPGQKLGDYEVRSQLGSGGMGEVYAGEQPMIGKKVAIKVLKSEIAAEPGNVQRMLSEARSVNAIRHRSIVDIFNFGTLPDGRPYLVMEYLEGTALDVMLRKEGALSPADVTEFLEEICSALAAAHARGIVHRDLKPGNVFIVSDGNTRNRYVKLLDFGLAKGEASGEATKQTRAGMVVGTPDYIAPEQARGGTITPRTDLYSLGVMAFEMLTGGLPFTAESVVELMMMHVQAPAPRVSSKIDFCPPALDALIYQLMSKEPEARPRSADIVRQDIARIRREMREGETMIGVSAPPPASKDTIRIAQPEADTPDAVPFADSSPRTPLAVPRPGNKFPEHVSTGRRVAHVPAEQATRNPDFPEHVSAGRRVAATPAEPTARNPVVVPRRRPGSSTKVIAAVAALLVVASAVAWWWYSNQNPVTVTELPPLPPPTRKDPPPTVVTPVKPEVVVTPLPNDPPQPLPPVDPPPVVKANPPRPPRPVVKSGAAASPTREELNNELKVLLDRQEKKNHFSPQILKQIQDHYKKQINEASTVEERQKTLKDMRDSP